MTSTTPQPGSKKPATRTSSTTRDLALIAVFTAIIIVLGFVSIPVGAAGVPIVLQNAAVILAGLVLGGRRGFFTAALFLLIGLALPVLAGGRTTIYAIGSPTVGYLVGYLISAFVAGFIAYRAPQANKLAATLVLILAGFVGLFFQYLCGVFGLMWRSGLDFGAAWAAQLPFVLPDSGKVAVMVAIALAVHAAFPHLKSSEMARR